MTIDAELLREVEFDPVLRLVSVLPTVYPETLRNSDPPEGIAFLGVIWILMVDSEFV